MKKLFSTFLILLSISTIYSQSLSEEKFIEMQNAFLLGLNNKGLEICHELISHKEYSEIRPKALEYIADRFYYLSFLDSNFISYENVSRSYTLFKMFLRDYPNHPDVKKIEREIDYLTSTYSSNARFGEFFDKISAERITVVNKLEYIQRSILGIEEPYPIRFLQKEIFKGDAIAVANKYLDDIILNNPEFEIYGYFYKILISLDKFTPESILHKRKLPIETDAYLRDPIDRNWELGKLKNNEGFVKDKNNLDQLLLTLDKKYPKHDITLDLHFIFSQVFLYTEHKKICWESLEHLNYILLNDEYKSGPRYLITKEFVLNNQFADKSTGESKSP